MASLASPPAPSLVPIPSCDAPRSAKRTKRSHAAPPSTEGAVVKSASSSGPAQAAPPSVESLLPTPESTPPRPDRAAREQDAQKDPLPPPSAGSSSHKDRFVAGLVGASVIAIESIWGPSPPASTPGAVLPLQWFVKEVLRRSRTSCSTLQVALYYLHRARREIRAAVASRSDAYPSPPATPIEGHREQDEGETSPVLCGRRMFLAALICASKYLQDKNYSNRAWAKISGLAPGELARNERAVLALLEYRLHLGAEDFDRWTDRLATLASQGAALEATSSLARCASSSAFPPPPADVARSSTKRASSEPSLRPALRLAITERKVARLPPPRAH